MLNEMKHRGPDDVEVLIDQELVHGRSVDELNLKEKKVHIGIGTSRLATSNDYEGIQLIKGCKDFFIILNGEIYNHQEFPNVLKSYSLATPIDIKVIIHIFEEQLKKYDLIEVIKRTLRCLYGMYIIAIAQKDRIIVLRDPVGIKPLYLAENNALIAFASERKALWKIGITNDILSLQPGNFAIINREGIRYHKGSSLKEESPLKIKFEEAQRNLLSLLAGAVKKLVKIKKLGVLFSGGLDSYLVAHIASNLGTNVELFCSSFNEYRDKQNALSGAKSIGLPLHLYQLTLNEIEKSLPKILFAIEDPSPTNLSIAIPIYFATKLAKERSFRILLSGQGSDEIFGGYAKYESILENEGYQKLHHRLYQDIFNIANRNLQRDDGASMANGVEIRLPFLDFELINYAMRIPPEFKIKQINSNYVRKYILRSLAKSLNLPEEIVTRKKTAVQYGSGSLKALKILAKKNGYDSLQTYLQEEFANIMKNYHN